jgi:hypothetical protein
MGISLVKSDATNKDLRNAIEKAYPFACKQLESKVLARKLRGRTDQETARNIFNWVVTNIKYNKDGANQIVRLPSGILRTKEGDCKSMSLLIASLLANNGITPTFIYTSYRPDPTPSHIYVEMQDGTILDAVWRRYNSEKTPTHKYKKIMDISYLSGIDGCSCGLGAINLKPKQKTTQTKKPLINLSKVGQGVKKVGLSAGRTLFLAMIKNNLDGTASKLATGNITSQTALWKKAGGDAVALGNAIKTGASKKPKKLNFLPKLKGILLKKKINGIGEDVDKETIKAIRLVATGTGTAIGSSVPAVGNVVGAGAGASFGEVLIIVLPMIKEMIAKTPTTEAVGENAPPVVSSGNDLPPDEPNATDGSGAEDNSGAGAGAGAGTSKMLLYGALAVGGFLLYKNFKK